MYQTQFEPFILNLQLKQAIPELTNHIGLSIYIYIYQSSMSPKHTHSQVVGFQTIEKDRGTLGYPSGISPY